MAEPRQFSTEQIRGVIPSAYVTRAEFDAWLDHHDRRVRDDERRELFGELTRGILFDGDTDRVIKAAYARREKAVPVTA